MLRIQNLSTCGSTNSNSYVLKNSFQLLSFYPHRLMSLPVCPKCSSYLSMTWDALLAPFLLSSPLFTFQGPVLSSFKRRLGAAPLSGFKELQSLAISSALKYKPSPTFCYKLVIAFQLEHKFLHKSKPASDLFCSFSVAWVYDSSMNISSCNAPPKSPVQPFVSERTKHLQSVGINPHKLLCKMSCHK